AEALAPAGAGGPLPGQLRVQVIVEVPFQHALLDQHLALARVALVVDVERAAAAGHGAVVDDGDELGGDLLAQLAGEERGPLADEVRLEAVSDRLVEQDPAPARSEDHRLRTGRR